jgi:large subunit ribosomal protein L10e
MRGAWGKPYGSVARVNMYVAVSTCLYLLTLRSGQVIMSIRCKDVHRPVIIEALRRARYKFPGRQKIIVSKKWGFTSLNRADYEALKKDKQVINDGAYVQVSRQS